jgi:hypothetical protein
LKNIWWRNGVPEGQVQEGTINMKKRKTNRENKRKGATDEQGQQEVGWRAKRRKPRRK